MAEPSTLMLDRDGGVVRVVLNRPDRLNAHTPQMWRELELLGRELCADPTVRVVIVSGAGRSFSSGLDTAVFAEGLLDAPGFSDHEEVGTLDSHPTIDAILRAQAAFTWFESAPFVTIAALHGHALGAGLQLALACDLRVAAHSTNLGLLEFRYGIIPDLGATQRLPRLVGLGRAKELIFTAATIDAAEAHRIGLVERVVADDGLEAAVDSLAQHLAAQAPLAVRGAKQALNLSGSVSVAEGLRIEAELQRECLRSADMVEALAAALEGRTPNFQGR
jgi:enoyl-CoA hydratase/carnithine racemase